MSCEVIVSNMYPHLGNFVKGKLRSSICVALSVCKDRSVAYRLFFERWALLLLFILYMSICFRQTLSYCMHLWTRCYANHSTYFLEFQCHRHAHTLLYALVNILVCVCVFLNIDSSLPSVRTFPPTLSSECSMLPQGIWPFSYFRYKRFPQPHNLGRLVMYILNHVHVPCSASFFSLFVCTCVCVC